ncbi:hypothetical protein GLOIN_2v498954 [Rhizophagus clarus]|uniref:Uncharacterized protein n=1 Tax=Rhizophagus clarus TaxID=94130 RepID=A0A8H3LB51_9GLOM|nr:hypothetical protein GLOIN_2v498954 [Rhizophagus clarus]
MSTLLNLSYISLSLSNDEIIEFQNLLISCKFLNSLEVNGIDYFDWNQLFEILIKSSPINLLTLGFYAFSIDSDFITFLKLFFDSWKNRCPILLKIRPLRFSKFATVTVATIRMFIEKL